MDEVEEGKRKEPNVKKKKWQGRNVRGMQGKEEREGGKLYCTDVDKTNINLKHLKCILEKNPLYNNTSSHPPPER